LQELIHALSITIEFFAQEITLIEALIQLDFNPGYNPRYIEYKELLTELADFTMKTREKRIAELEHQCKMLELFRLKFLGHTLVWVTVIFIPLDFLWNSKTKDSQ
jgi:hypothetical protein